MLEKAHDENIDVSSSAGESCQRDPNMALLLSICPGLGQHYAGHLVRGVIAYILLIILSWLAAVAFMYVESRISMVLLATPFLGMAVIAFDAYRCASNQPNSYRLKWFNKEWIYGAVFFTLMVTVNPLMDYIVGQHIVRAYLVNSPSMHPTLILNDIVLANKLVKPKKGELALIELSDQARSIRQFSNLEAHTVFSRVAATEGDTVEVNKNGIFINGVLLPEVTPAAEDTLIAFDEEDKFGPEQVPANSVFVVADDRHFGIDSRILGFVNYDHIGGKITKVFWSWNLDEGHFKWERTAMSLK